MASDQYARLGLASWRVVYPPQPCSYAQPTALGKQAPLLLDRLARKWPAMGVLDLPRGSLVGPAGWVLGRGGCLLPEHSWYGMDTTNMSMPATWPEPQDMAGTCLLLTSDWSEGNYGHFMLDAIPRLHLFEQAGFQWNDVDHIYCASNTPDKARAWLGRFGVPVKKCILQPMAAGESRRFERLLAPTFPGVRRNYPQWTSEYLRRALGGRTLPSKRALYVTRAGGQRQAKNEAEIIPVLKRFGFELYDPMNKSAPWKDFAQARFIVGAHGAGLTDLAFCLPGTSVLELLPSDHQFPYYCSLSLGAGLRYAYLVCNSEVERDATAWGPSTHDFYVDPIDLVRSLQWLLDAS